MWLITILFGAALMGVGGAGFAIAGFELKGITALIPAVVGVLLVGCGVLARQDNLRKHAMHTAVLIGLLGFLIAAIRLAMKLPTVLSEGKFMETPAIQMTTIMAVLCLVFVGLCINSFVQVRRARSKQPQV